MEVDGSTHGEVREIRYDAERTAYLGAVGYRVFRFYNADVFENLSGVLEGILLRLEGE